MAEDEPENSIVQAVESKPKRKRGPLTVEEFREVLQKIKSMGMAWSTDIPPSLLFEKRDSEDKELNEELRKMMRLFPNFPLELSSVIFYILTGKTMFDAGPKDLREQKADVVRESGIITDTYRSEFFFKHATKVPYFADLDWEVVIKEFERGVAGTPAVSYALLSLKIESSRGPIETRSRSIAVAVNHRLVEELIAILTDVSKALQKSSTVATSVNGTKAKEGED